MSEHAAWAEDKIVKAASDVAAHYDCSVEVAKDYVLERYPEWARLANNGRAVVEKSEGVWSEIVEAATAMVEKSGEDLDETRRIAKFLKTAEGRKLNEAYNRETGFFA